MLKIEDILEYPTSIYVQQPVKNTHQVIHYFTFITT